MPESSQVIAATHQTQVAYDTFASHIIKHDCCLVYEVRTEGVTYQAYWIIVVQISAADQKC